MKKRYAYFSSFTTAGELIPTEEEASSWLWVSPQLLDWPHKLHWLWSHVDSRKSVARLWGIDTTGTLIIVDIRKDRGDAPDPFGDLVHEIKDSSTDRHWTAAALREKWRKCWLREPLETAHGRSVERLLKRRDNSGNPHPVLVGVVASTQQEFRLSAKAQRNLEHLRKRFGDERVRLSVISGTFSSRGLRVQCTTANERLGPQRSRRSPYSTRVRVWQYARRFVAQC